MIWVIIVVVILFYSYRFLFSATESEQEQEVKRTPAPLRTIIPPVEIPRTTTFSPRDQIVGGFESLNWCNDITEICWPQIAKIVESQLSPTLEPLINLYLPKPFSNFRFVKARLGANPLNIKRVIVHRRFHDSIAMDLDVEFCGKPNISMKCAPLRATFGIQQLSWTGRLSILMRPLLPTLPLVGAVQAAMITHPELKMDFTGVANIAEFGPIERIVKMVLKNVLSSMVVLPNRFLYKLTDSVDYFKVYHPPIGIIVITIDRGRGFTKEKKMGVLKVIPDLYCKGTFALEEMKTSVQMNCLSPIWKEAKAFILSDHDQFFDLHCYDKDTVTRDDRVGSTSIIAKQLLQAKEDWYPLVTNIDKKIAKQGQIFISAQLLTFGDPEEPVRGLCVLSILIDRAKNLPKNTKAAACRVTVGNNKKNKIVRETPKISKPDPPIPGIDPVNPIWSFSFDILCDDFKKSDVKLEVVDGKNSIGYHTINAEELEASASNIQEGEFPIGRNATLRAKVILHGLVPDKLRRKESTF